MIGAVSTRAFTTVVAGWSTNNRDRRPRLIDVADNADAIRPSRDEIVNNEATQEPEASCDP